ncbi:conserved hypothetical protein (plasmid) [Allorhizobium ampelinum S4]|uniref:Uncharacterized protein n=1 Tax=Allorhizobium ampelinum (strain ATCC BAA-846 / DSM 112012 / S4) TaxID=311402 RepID=B9K344_ALLAM|nr:hypothetical protein [Allorhizobium ampelinum]ACM39292.1 conserved hypothetical protein [Allorhizobium ampelinum S4]
MVEYGGGTPFCNALPERLRSIVDMMTPQLLAETWPLRFVALLSMLEDMAGEAGEVDRPLVVNKWVAIVSGLLENLPRDMDSSECLALMRHSAIETFRKRATLQSPDVSQQDELLRSTYPQWSVVEDLLDEYEAWAAHQLRTTRH